jgi:hypothetical protein
MVNQGRDVEELDHELEWLSLILPGKVIHATNGSLEKKIEGPVFSLSAWSLLLALTP